MESVTPLSEESPNWLDLPPEVTAAILQKVDALDILNHVQLVCTSWHTICKDPSMWRSIVMLSERNMLDCFNAEKMARHVIDRSCGQLVDISIGWFDSDKIIHYLAQSSCQLRRLQIVSCPSFSKDLLKETASKFPMLEELKVQSTPLSIDAIEAIGQCCPQLKSFKCNAFKYISRRSYHENLAKMIAKTMPQLYHLELLWTEMTNAGLKAILDGCPYLETLYLCSCNLSNLKVDHLDEVCYTRYKRIVRYQEEPDEELCHEWRWMDGAVMTDGSCSDDSSYYDGGVDYDVDYYGVDYEVDCYGVNYHDDDGQW